MKIDGVFGLTVYISDPAAKTKRSHVTDAKLFIGGLSSHTKQKDIEELLQPVSTREWILLMIKYGSIINVKLGWDPVKLICKGFAFVDMASKASFNRVAMTGLIIL